MMRYSMSDEERGGRREESILWVRWFSCSPLPSPLTPLLTLFLLLFAGCDGADPGTFEEEYVVESYLIAGEPLQQVRVSRTARLDAQYDFTALAVQGAAVRVLLLDGNGGVEARYPFREKAGEPGIYVPEELLIPALPLRRYRLEVDAPDGAIRAETVVPDTFSVIRASADTVVYQSTAQLEITVTQSRVPGREQSYFVFVTESLDPRAEMLTPFANALYDNGEGDFVLEDFRISGSPILNERNYDLHPDGTLTLKVPWLAINFYGPNRLFANVLDDNLYDYVRSQSVQQGGSTLSPGEIPNPIEQVEGARGVFGSYARSVREVFVRRPGG